MKQLTSGHVLIHRTQTVKYLAIQLKLQSSAVVSQRKRLDRKWSSLGLDSNLQGSHLVWGKLTNLHEECDVQN